MCAKGFASQLSVQWDTNGALECVRMSQRLPDLGTELHTKVLKSTVRPLELGSVVLGTKPPILGTRGAPKFGSAISGTPVNVSDFSNV